MGSKETNRDIQEHRSALNKLYSDYDFSKNPWGYGLSYIDFTRDAVCTPIAHLLADGNVLDAGSGYGFFRRYTEGRMHIGIDLSQEIMRHDESNTKVQSAVEYLPFSDQSIDNVVCIGVLRHCFDPTLFVTEAKRVLKPGGRLLVSTPSSDWPANLMKTPWKYLVMLSHLERLISRMFARIVSLFSKKNTSINISDGVVYDRRYTAEQLRELVEENFEILEQGRSGVDFPSRLHPPKRLIQSYYDEAELGRFLFIACRRK